MQLRFQKDIKELNNSYLICLPIKNKRRIFAT